MKKVVIVGFSALIWVILAAPVVFAARGQSNVGGALRPEKVLFHSEYGTIESISGRFAAPSAATRVGRAQAFISAESEYFKMEHPEKELQLLTEKTDELGLTHLRFQQVYEGLRVWGCQTIVHFEDDNTIYLVGGQTIPTPRLSTDAAISAADAAQRAVASLEDQLNYSDLETEVELVIYPGEGNPGLARLVTITHPADGSVRWRVFVDARTGEILQAFNDIHFDGPDIGTGPDTRDSMRAFDIYETGGIYQMINTTHNGLITTYDNYYNGGPISTDPDNDKVWDDFGSQKAEVAGHYYGDVVYDYFLNTHGRDSYDGAGTDLIVNVHDPRYINNAYWNGFCINFADGDGVNWLPFSGGLDVVAHELTHGVTEYTAGLIYRFQSGALSESFSDFFGAMVDRDDWLIGDEISLFGGFIRNMANPSASGHPMHMDDYRNLPISNDLGGVHINCGIPNHSGYRTAILIGRDKAEQIWYRALSTYLTPSSGFYFWAGMIMQSTIDLYGASSPEVSNVELSLAWVGLASAYSMPRTVQLEAVAGEVEAVSLWIFNPGTSTGSLDVSAVAPSIPNLTVSAGPGYQATIPDGDSSEFIISYDATGVGECDFGISRDTIQFNVDGPYVTMYIKLPLVLSIGNTAASVESESFSSSCVVAEATNTSNLDLFSRDDVDALYAASLLVGLIDGNDTTVYRDVHGVENFAPVDSISSDTGMVWFTTISEDSRIRAEVTYTFGIDDPDACGFIIADYVLYNVCDTPLTVLNGFFADFDIGDADSNLADFDDVNEMIYLTDETETRAAALALLSGSSRNLRTISNPFYVWDGAFTDGVAYMQMAALSNTSDPSYDDWSVLLTFGDGQLSPEDTLRYQMALLYSNSGTADLTQILEDAIIWLGGGYVCGDADGSGAINILDVTNLINYLYKEGPAPDPIEAGDANGSGSINILDVNHLINYLYKEGPEPVCP